MATKPPPPGRLRQEIYEDMLFPYHAQVDHSPKLHGELDLILHTQANDRVVRALSSTLAKPGPFRDDRIIYFRGKPFAAPRKEESSQQQRSTAPLVSVSFSDLGDQVQLKLLEVVDYLFVEKGHA